MLSPLASIASLILKVIDRLSWLPFAAPIESVERRANKYLERLSGRPNSLLFKIALHDLQSEHDLLDEEAVHTEYVLELQLLIIELAASDDTARAIATTMLNEPPIAKLFGRTVLGTLSDDAPVIRIRFDDETDLDHVVIKYCKNGQWEIAATIPRDLSRALYGCAYRAEKAGYDSLLPLLANRGELPEQIRFIWKSNTEFEARTVT